MNEQPFIPTKLEDERDKDEVIISLRLNKALWDQLQADMKILEQPKPSTAVKMLMGIGSNALHDNLIGNILQVVFKNKRKNKRLGIMDFEL
jgi:hypothetical protein